MKLLLCDNYDSFTYNLVHRIREIAPVEIDVIRNDKIDLEALGDYNKILLSPGPGVPSEAGLMPELVRRFGSTKSILGVCLGHQCIAESYGATLHNMRSVVHGKATKIKVLDAGRIFKGLPETLDVGRYHSWVANREGFPDCLKITALSEDGYIMALEHKQYAVSGVQFHPESVLTESGLVMLKNWLDS